MVIHVIKQLNTNRPTEQATKHQPIDRPNNQTPTEQATKH